MSVLLECQPGDAIFCIESFAVTPEGVPFSWGDSRRFKVGQRVEFVAARRAASLKNQPGGWMVAFKDDGAVFAATQTYFVTDDCWQGLAAHFLDQHIRKLRGKGRSNASAGRSANR